MYLGQTLSFLEIPNTDIFNHSNAISRMVSQEFAGIIVRSAFSKDLMKKASSNLLAASTKSLLCSPNQGMPGGELQTIGAAATPTFTALNGPSKAAYVGSSRQAKKWQKLIFDAFDMESSLSTIFSQLYEHKLSRPAPFYSPMEEGTELNIDQWLPFNYRILPNGVQIYSHHDQHYRLPIYKHLSDKYDKNNIYSWFVCAQPPYSGGELIVYGLTSDDPNPPLLPTRFIDTAALEKSYYKATVNLDVGDLVIFNSGRFVHRVSQVEGPSARVTVGGFMTKDKAASELIYWS